MRGVDTPENLARVLSHELPAAGVVTAEAGIVLGAHGMGQDSIMRNLAQLSILWDGGVLDVGRRTPSSFKVHGARLVVGLQIPDESIR
jgi:putative DNA primase/helicase